MFLSDRAVPWSTADLYEMPICPDCDQEMSQGGISKAMSDANGWEGPYAWNCITAECVSLKLAVRQQNTDQAFKEKVESNDYLLQYGVGKGHIECTFENFVPKAKRESLKDVYGKFLVDSKMNILMKGKTGTGKTHIAVAFLREIIKKKVTSCELKNVSELMMSLRNTFNSTGRTETEKDMVDRYTGIKLLILDDMGSEKATDYVETIFYNILNRRLNDQRRTIITTNLSLKEVGDLYGARIQSRLTAYHSVEFTGKDWRVR